MSDLEDTDTIEIEDWVLTGCACPACSATRGDVVADAAFSEQTATAGGYQIDTDPDDPDQAINALLGGISWNTTSLTFSFPDSSDDFGYNWSGERNGFGAFNDAQAEAARDALEVFASVSGLTFTELTGDADRDADLRFAESTYAGTAYAYFPSGGEWGGDAWFNTWHFNNPEVGTYGWSTFLHEIGHAIGLKHGHEDYGAGALPFEMDSHEYSLMTYRSYEGSSGAFYSNETFGGPQSLMMLDIAAVQVLYGANYDHNSGDTIYAFDPETGQMLVDGDVEATPGANRILRTIWDGDGQDTYDLSDYDSDLAIDLTPGGYVDLDVGGLAQRSRLGAGEYAKGHIFNALQWEGDDRSLIENAIAGVGDDTLLGNQAANRLEGGAGADVLAGGAGDDVLIGGEGDDIAVFDGAFSDFIITFADDALEVLGDGLDRVYSSVEILRFDDRDAAFSEFVPEVEPEQPSEPKGDAEVDDTPQPEEEISEPEFEIDPTADPGDGDLAHDGDLSPDEDDLSEPDGDELVDPPSDPDEPSIPEDEELSVLTDELPQDEEDDLVLDPEEPAESEDEGLSDPLDEPTEDELPPDSETPTELDELSEPEGDELADPPTDTEDPFDPEGDVPVDPVDQPVDEKSDLEGDLEPDPDEPSNLEEDNLDEPVEDERKPEADPPAELKDPVELEKPAELETDELLDTPDEPEIDNPVDPPVEPVEEKSDPEAEQPSDLDEPSGKDNEEPSDQPIEPVTELPVADEPVVTEPEDPFTEDPDDKDQEDDSRRVPVVDDPLIDADETDELDPSVVIEAEDEKQPDLSIESTDDDLLEETSDEIELEDKPPALTGDTQNDDVFVFGETRADDLSGGNGDDVISGAGGEDTLRGGQGEDSLSGDAGDDLLLGGAENDLLSGGGGADLLKGGSGDDFLMGGSAADTLNGGSGDDQLSGGGGRDRLVGRSGDDRLDGGGGADTLRGNAGDDSLEGGAGRDVLAGGGGIDSFVFDDRFGRDRIADFDADREALDFSQHSRVNGLNDLVIVQGGAGVVILDGAGGRILLSGVERTEINESDFIF